MICDIIVTAVTKMFVVLVTPDALDSMKKNDTHKPKTLLIDLFRRYKSYNVCCIK